MPRQSVTCRSWPPITGARIGARPITIISRENSRAASTPSKRSRTIARPTTMPAAPATPCNSRTAESVHTSLHSAQPTDDAV